MTNKQPNIKNEGYKALQKKNIIELFRFSKLGAKLKMVSFININIITLLPFSHFSLSVAQFKNKHA